MPSLNACARPFRAAARTARGAAIVAGTLTVASCNWISLAEHALSYPPLARGEVGNVVAFDSLYFATAGDDGFTVRDAAGATLVTVASAPGSESVDDITVDGQLARRPKGRAPADRAA